MYLLIVLLLMLVLPTGSIYVEHSYPHSSAPTMLLVGKWFVFWSAGVRLFLAGLRQFFQPRFTADQIFGIKSDDALPLGANWAWRISQPASSASCHWLSQVSLCRWQSARLYSTALRASGMLRRAIEPETRISR